MCVCVHACGCGCLCTYQLELFIEKHYGAASCFECHPQPNNQHAASRKESLVTDMPWIRIALQSGVRQMTGKPYFVKRGSVGCIPQGRSTHTNRKLQHVCLDIYI